MDDGSKEQANVETGQGQQQKAGWGGSRKGAGRKPKQPKPTEKASIDVPEDKLIRLDGGVAVIKHRDAIVYHGEGRCFATSRDLAFKFGKRHDHVLAAIDNRKSFAPEGFRLPNFRESSYVNEQGKEQRQVEMTRAGFAFAAFAFTGPEAALFQVHYIEAFELMERALRESAHAMDASADIMRLTAADLSMISERTTRAATEAAVEALAPYMSSLTLGHTNLDTKVNGIAQNLDGLKTEVEKMPETFRGIAKEAADEAMKNLEDRRKKPIGDITKETHCVAVLILRAGMCPICRKIRIVDDTGGKLDSCVFDHWESRQEVGLVETIACCIDCNAEMGEPNSTVRQNTTGRYYVQFHSYQIELHELLNGRTRLRRRDLALPQLPFPPNNN